MESRPRKKIKLKVGGSVPTTSSGKKRSRRSQRGESGVTNSFARGKIRWELLGSSSDDSSNGDVENEIYNGTQRYSGGLRGIHDHDHGDGNGDGDGDGRRKWNTDSTMSDDIPRLPGCVGTEQQQHDHTSDLSYGSSSIDLSLRNKLQQHHVHHPPDESEPQRLLTITPRSHLAELKQNNAVLRSHNVALVKENERLKKSLEQRGLDGQGQQQQQQGYDDVRSKELARCRGEIGRLKRENAVLLECGIEWARREVVLGMEVERLRRVVRNVVDGVGLDDI